MITARRVWPLLLVILLVSAAASPLLALAQQAVGPNDEVLRLTTLSTAVGAAVVLLVWRPLPRPPVTRRGTVLPLALGALAAAVAMALLWVGTMLTPGEWPVLDVGALPAPLVVVLLVQVLGAAAEEVGWRGVVQPALETRMRALPAWLVTGLLFGLGHVYVLAAGVLVFAAFLVSAVALSVVLGALTAGRSLVARVGVATAVHWLVNVGLMAVFSDGDESLTWTTLTAAALVLVAVPAVIGSASRRPAPAAPVG